MTTIEDAANAKLNAHIREMERDSETEDLAERILQEWIVDENELAQRYLSDVDGSYIRAGLAEWLAQSMAIVPSSQLSTAVFYRELRAALWDAAYTAAEQRLADSYDTSGEDDEREI